MNEGRLPKPTGRVTARVRLALRTYRRLGAAGVPPLKATVYRGVLNATLAAMTRQETAEYYAGVRKLREAAG